MNIPYLIRDNSVVVVVNGKSHNILSSHPNYNEIREAIKLKDFKKIPTLVDIPASFAVFSEGRVTVRDGAVYYGDMPMHNSLTRRILTMKGEGFDIGPMVRFMENLMLNPSKRAVDELYTFLEKNDLPLTEDGHFLAYKKVRLDYKDIYTGTMDNSIGAKPFMERNQVDDEKENTCSKGLHFASISYLPHYSGGTVGIDCRVVIVKINPRDVVSIPVDYNHAKGRCCLYEVVGEHTSQDVERFTKTVYDSKGNTVEPAAKKESVIPDNLYTVADGTRDGQIAGKARGRADGQLNINTMDEYEIDPGIGGLAYRKAYANAFETAYAQAWNAERALRQPAAPAAAPGLELTRYFQKFRKIVVDHLGVDDHLVVPNATFESLGADSLDTVELVMAVEEEFGVEFPDEEAERMRTVGDVVRWLISRLDPKPNTSAHNPVRVHFDNGQKDGMFHGAKNGGRDGREGNAPSVFKMKANTNKTQDYVDGFNDAYRRAYVSAYRRNAMSLSKTQENALDQIHVELSASSTPKVKLYTEVEACRALGIDRNALRKRADRGHSVSRVVINGTTYFKIK